MKPQRVIPEKCKGFELAVETRDFTWRDAALYSLSVGVSTNPLDDADLSFTYENHSNGFQILPSFATVLPSIQSMFDALLACPGFPSFNPMMLLHGEEKIVMKRPFMTEEKVVIRSIVQDVYDKESGALIIVQSKVTESETNDEICSAECSLFIRGIGGFGGPVQPKKESSKVPSRAPDFTHTLKTTPNQALIYRLSGDYNPLHADPTLAATGGFSQPILHGLCTFGIATHGIVKHACGNQAENIVSVEGRFTAPVLPGDTLEVQIWRISPARVLFGVFNTSKDGSVCLSNGVAVTRVASSL